jgi:hypothetical protein
MASATASTAAVATEVPVQVAVRIKPITEGHRFFQPIAGVTGGINEVDSTGKAVAKHSFMFGKSYLHSLTRPPDQLFGITWGCRPNI